jgi:hypothetical protein
MKAHHSVTSIWEHGTDASQKNFSNVCPLTAYCHHWLYQNPEIFTPGFQTNGTRRIYLYFKVRLKNNTVSLVATLLLTELGYR